MAALTPEQRDRVVQMLRQNLPTDDIARELGIGDLTVRAIKAHLTMGTYGTVADGAFQEVEDATESVVSLEKDLQAALRNNLTQLEPGLRVVDRGKECRVAAGFIDILAEDQAGCLVVIELKASIARPEALTQLLGYMGTVEAGPAGVRGLLVASEFHPKLLHAVKAVPNVALREYRFQFNFREPSK